MIPDRNGEPDSQPRMPSLIALRCFEAAARLENFSRAAEELHLTPGAISRAVRLLEDELGIPLFDRRSRRVPERCGLQVGESCRQRHGSDAPGY